VLGWDLPMAKYQNKHIEAKNPRKRSPEWGQMTFIYVHIPKRSSHALLGLTNEMHLDSDLMLFCNVYLVREPKEWQL
jgi:hypothetical protein